MKAIRRFLVLQLLLFCIALKAVSQLPPQPPIAGDPHRGMYLDNFVKFTNQSLNGGTPAQGSGEFVIDTSNSILAVDKEGDGIFEKEDELLQYCADNHITHLTLYDLKNIFKPSFGDPTYVAKAWDATTQTMMPLPDHLCRFMNKAYQSYGITEIAAAGVTSDFLYNSVIQGPPNTTEADFNFSNAVKSSPAFNPELLFIENPANNGSLRAEAAKQFLTILGFGGCNPCASHFTSIDLEVEFWNPGQPTFTETSIIIKDLYFIKQLNNSINPTNPISIDEYIGDVKDNVNSNWNYQTIAAYLDGCATCPAFFAPDISHTPVSQYPTPHPRIVDKIMLVYYNDVVESNAWFKSGSGNSHGGGCATVYNLNSDPCNTLFNDNQTLITPLLNAEGREYGGADDFLGKWLRKNIESDGNYYGNYDVHNIFMAERNMYKSYLDYEFCLFNSGLDRLNIVYNGGTHWFASSQMYRYLKNPVLFSLFPVNQSGPMLDLRYCGPLEAGTNYTLTISGAGNYINSGTLLPIDCNNLSDISHSIFSNQLVYQFPNGISTVTLDLAFTENGIPTGQTLSYSETINCLLAGALPTIQIINGSSIRCEGEQVILGGSSDGIEWYKDGQNPNNLVATTASHNFTDSDVGTHQYWTHTANGFSANSVTVTWYQNPNVYVIADPNDCALIGPGNVRLHAITMGNGASAGLLYKWSTGEEGPMITAPSGDYAAENEYQVTVTSPDGCARTARYYFGTSIDLNTPPTVNPNVTPNLFCYNSGTAICELNITPNTGNPPPYISFITPGNDFVAGLSPAFENLTPGTYSYYVTPTYNSGCGATSTFTINSNMTNLNITAQITDATGCTMGATVNDLPANNGSLTVNVGIGVATPVEYKIWPPGNSTWSTSNTTILPAFNNLSPGSYRIDVRDANGCTAFAIFNVGYDYTLKPVMYKVTTTDVGCAGTTTGSAQIDGCFNNYFCVGCLPSANCANNNVNGILDIDFSNGSSCNACSALPATALAAGQYSVTVTNPTNQCADIRTFYIGEPTPLHSEIMSITGTCTGTLDGTAEVEVCGGNGHYDYSMDNVSVASNQVASMYLFTGLSGGPHTLRISVNNCPATYIDVIITIDEYNCCTSPGATVIPPTGLDLSVALPPNIFTLTYGNTDLIDVNGNITIPNGYTLECHACTMKIAQGRTIEVLPGGTLLIDGAASLTGCGDMWHGIKSTTGTVTITGNSAASKVYIQDALIALDDMASLCAIEFVDFNLNYTAISLKNGNYQSSYFRNCIFRCHGNFLPLHNADQPPQQILITAATGVKIGEAGNGNILSDAINGIVAERSNVEVYSNTFSNFRYQMQGLGVGYAIKAKGDNINQFTLTVGTSATDYNTINDCQMGILATKGMNCFFHSNHINLVASAISITNCSSNNKIEIYENLFANFKTLGIYLSDNHYAVVHVERNRLNDLLPFSAGTESTKGIYVGNTTRSKPAMTIKENWIYNCRFGVHVQNQDNCYITANKIFFQMPDQEILNNLTIFRNGIIVQDGFSSHKFGFQVSYNEIYHAACAPCPNTNVALKTHLRGISIETSWADVHDNYCFNLPTMARVYMNCKGTNFHCNVWDQGQQGYFWDTGAQLSDQGDPLDATNNEWRAWIGTNRIEGGNLGVPWYYDFALATSDNNYNPVPFLGNSIAPLPALPNNENCTGIYNGGGGHQDQLMRIINDSNYVQNFSENKYHDKESVYQQLKDSLELMYAGTTYDAGLQNFFSLTALSNIGLLDNVRDYLNNGDLAAALLANGSINPENLMEANAKFVNTICAQIAEDTITYDSLQKVQLLSIAYQLPIIGGEAVYRARAILKLDVDDTQLEYRMQGNPKTSFVTDYSLYPNPNAGSFTLQYQLGEKESAHVTVYDGIGKILEQSDLPLNSNAINFDLSSNGNGIYLVHLVTSGLVEKYWKIVVLK